MAGIIGIDIGGTWFRVGTVAPDGRLSDFRKLPVREIFRSREPLSDLCAFLHGYVPGKEIRAIAIGFPATLDKARKTVLQGPNIPFLENLPVVEVLGREFSVPVFIERDVTMALTYDAQALQLPEEGIVCGIYFGTGVGNAIHVDGRPLLGRHGTAGELGHIPVDGVDIPCGCGNTGCMELVAGGQQLVRLCRDLFPDTHIREVFLRHPEHPEVLRFLDRMACAVAIEANLLDPDHILIGGGVPNMAGFPKEKLLRLILEHTRKPLPAQDLKILFTGDREDKCVLGSALYAAFRMRSVSGRESL